MPYRRTVLVEGEVYHVICRGVAKRPVFQSQINYQRAFELVDYYRFSKPPIRFSHYKRLPSKQRKPFLKKLQKDHPLLVDIYAYCFMKNHIHFLVKQTAEKGISVFMNNFQNSYAKYFNKINESSGPVFQPMFRVVRVSDDAQMLHVSRYIHLNPVSAYLIEIDKLEDYRWTSFSEYLGKNQSRFCNPKPILDFYKKRGEYRQFVYNQADYQRKLQDIKHLVLEKKP
ncbi:transposase [Patescibacteria group bacterium]